MERRTRFRPEEYLAKEAPNVLLASGAQTVEILSLRNVLVTKKFGKVVSQLELPWRGQNDSAGRRRSSIVEVVKSSHKGWLLGEFLWRYNDGGSHGGSMVVNAWLTAFALSENEPPSGYIVRIAKDIRRDGYVMMGGGIFLGTENNFRLQAMALPSSHLMEAVNAVRRIASGE
jgi:hypothetical protein